MLKIVAALIWMETSLVSLCQESRHQPRARFVTSLHCRQKNSFSLTHKQQSLSYLQFFLRGGCHCRIIYLAANATLVSNLLLHLAMNLWRKALQSINAIQLYNQSNAKAKLADAQLVSTAEKGWDRVADSGLAEPTFFWPWAKLIAMLECRCFVESVCCVEVQGPLWKVKRTQTVEQPTNRDHHFMAICC